MQTKSEQIGHAPTIVVLFGATGDLAQRKIIPALFRLHTKGRLPQQIHVVGFARRPLTHDDFRAHAREALENAQQTDDDTDAQSFFEQFSYSPGEFNDPASYQALANALSKIEAEWGVCANKLFYLAVPPQFYETIARNLARSKLTVPCSDTAEGGLTGSTPLEVNHEALFHNKQKPEADTRTEENQTRNSSGLLTGWTRVIIEKPFGKDLETAKELDRTFGELFEENQIYRIDHYLGKQMVQNILTFRFSNNLFEQEWNNECIERIDIRLNEKKDISDRGSFYDSVGALRDVGQNHLLQVLAFLTMEAPRDFSAPEIRTKRRALLESIARPREGLIKNFRAQYAGFTETEGVSSHSQTETYFKLQTELESDRWQGVPITLEGGKALKETEKETVVTFRHPRVCLCPNPESEHFKNTITFRFGPEEQIVIRFLAKEPGLDFTTTVREFDFLLHSRTQKDAHTDEYEKLLLDCIIGDQTLFVGTAEIEAMWRLIDPVVRAWQADNIPLETYKPGTTPQLRTINN